MKTPDAQSWDEALDAVTAALGDIEQSVHGVMPTASWLEVVRMRVKMLRMEPEVNMDEMRVARLEEEMAIMKQSLLDLQQAIVDATSHKDMQASVADVALPSPVETKE